MAPLFLDPALLRKRVALETADLISDGAGGASTTWRELRELSVHIEPVSAVARERFDRQEAMVTHRVICRWTTDVERGRAFRLGTRRLAILSVHDPDETKRFLVCRCEEER